MIRVYKRDNHWLMDTTTKVGGRELPITVEPDHSHLALWEQLIPFSDAPCGHSSQYCYTEDGGKVIVCLLCERNKA
jgi:hypothetical protein